MEAEYDHCVIYGKSDASGKVPVEHNCNGTDDAVDKILDGDDARLLMRPAIR
jgi:hypothetical protein